ncbi:cell division protein SepF [Altericista sp. CCNU0014]|uniref:cell division protein SepF n=1 Tax=Altericista sp. CCNU0014 TaxID=3082949 RepID=UPI00384FBBF7
MSNFFGKLKEFVGIPGADEFDDYDDDLDMTGDEYASAYEPPDDRPIGEERVQTQMPSDADRMRSVSGAAGSGMSNVVGMPGAGRYWGSNAAEVLVLEPRAFEEMPQVIQALRERKSVVLNLSLMEPAQAQRSVDFVAGATFTIDGHQERVGENIFLFTPSCVEVRTQAGVIHEAPQTTATPSRMSANPWTDPVLSAIAQ